MRRPPFTGHTAHHNIRVGTHVDAGASGAGMEGDALRRPYPPGDGWVTVHNILADHGMVPAVQQLSMLNRSGGPAPTPRWRRTGLSRSPYRCVLAVVCGAAPKYLSYHCRLRLSLSTWCAVPRMPCPSFGYSTNSV